MVMLISWWCARFRTDTRVVCWIREERHKSSNGVRNAASVKEQEWSVSCNYERETIFR